MIYRLNYVSPFYMEYSDYNLKNVHLEEKRKKFGRSGRSSFKFYKKRLFEGFYKFGFYKDIINGELAVVDIGLKKIQVLKDEISGKDFDVRLSWVFAAKYLETQNNLSGYDYRFVYNRSLFCFSLLRLYHRNLYLRNKLRRWNLKPSFRLGFTRRGLCLSSLVFKKRESAKALLVRLLRVWHDNKISAFNIRIFTFLIKKIRRRLLYLNLLYFYYKFRFVKIFEALFLPVKLWSKKHRVILGKYVRKPPFWMLQRFGVKTHKKLAKGLKLFYYFNLACGVWVKSAPSMIKRLNVLRDFKEGLSVKSLNRKLVFGSKSFSLQLCKFFGFFYRNRKFHIRQKYRYCIRFFFLADLFFKKTGISGIKSFFNLLYSHLVSVLFLINFKNKNVCYNQFVYFCGVILQFTMMYRKGVGLISFFEVCRCLIFIPFRFLDIFFHKERLFLYNVGSVGFLYGLNAFIVFCRNKYIRRVSRNISLSSRSFLWKKSRRVWRLKKRFSWNWRKKLKRIFSKSNIKFKGKNKVKFGGRNRKRIRLRWMRRKIYRIKSRFFWLKNTYRIVYNKKKKAFGLKRNLKDLRRRNMNVRVTKMWKPNNKKYGVNKFPLGKPKGNFFNKGNKPGFWKVSKKG